MAKKKELNQYLGGEEGKKKRKKEWEKIEREKKLEEIRIKKMQKKLREIQKKKQKEFTEKQIKKAQEIWYKVDYVLKFCLTQNAYYYLERKRLIEPKLYKALFRCIVEPRVIQNIDSFVEHCRTKGGPKEKITLRTILWYEQRLTGKKRKTKIEIERHGIRKSL